MKRAIAVLLMFCTNMVAAQKGNKMNLLNDSSCVIIPYQSFHTSIFKDVTPTTLQPNEIKIIEKFLYSAVNKYNQQRVKEYEKYKKKNPSYTGNKKDVVINLKEYRIQLIPVLNKKGEKELWVNCFCRSYDIDWKKNLVGVRDGGKCYFNLKINLSKKKYYDFVVNGVA